MIFEFRTPTTRNGNYKYLAIETENHCFSRFNRHMTAPEAVTIKASDYRRMIDYITAAGWTEEPQGID